MRPKKCYCVRDFSSAKTFESRYYNNFILHARALRLTGYIEPFENRFHCNIHQVVENVQIIARVHSPAYYPRTVSTYKRSIRQLYFIFVARSSNK